ncbi:MAG: hypothetical protein IIC73_04850, partial [Armatimonadetes bacterium]|nr:hypothetical protein [Armatimonadota bacterium]
MAQTTKTEYGERVSTKVRLEMLARDRRVKIWLVVTSVVTIIALATAAVQENYLADWRLHQLEYADILESKATDELGEKLAANFEVEMRQIVLPGLDTIDRCISCHTGIDDPRMTDVEEPYKVHPGEYLNQHDVNTFGCTVCHRGQGRAMKLDEAKGVGYHWDYPMLPAGLTQSSCGLCHSAGEVATTGGELYAEGKEMFETQGFSSC